MQEIIAIQGIEGSFHHQVASTFFGEDAPLLKCMSFRELITQLSEGKADKAVMAIENSIAGAILANYAYIDEHNLKIIGEQYLPVDLNLMALPGETLEGITEVYSHPIALLQCKEFFKKKPHIKLVEDDDTAEVAKRIAKKQLKKIAAIASPKASEIFGLPILAKSIHTIQSNTTRFLILSRGDSRVENGENKASLKLNTQHVEGSLLNVLSVLKEHHLNMTKIQSLPIIDFPWKYSFFIDVVFEEQKNFYDAMDALKKVTDSCKILGTYKASKQ